MGKNSSLSTSEKSAIPADDVARNLTVAGAEEDRNLQHVAVVGDTYTILVSGEQTAGRYCLIDMLVPAGGGPPPHRHDFEEMFSIQEGEIEFVFRGEHSVLRAGETVNIPANAPHSFRNSSNKSARLLCMCAPAGQENFFLEVGTPVASRTTPAPKMSAAEQAAMKEKAAGLAAKYHTELLLP